MAKGYVHTAGAIVLIFILCGTWATWKATTNKTSNFHTTSTSSHSLLFDDEFNGVKLDTTKWNTCYDWYDAYYDGCTNAGNQELEWYTPTQVAVDGGSLVLTAQKRLVIGKNAANASAGTLPSSYPYISGMVSTGKPSLTGIPKWSGSYGYYEMRAELPSGDGIWPAFWLLPVNDQWPPEIDIMELLGRSPNQILMTYFWPDGQYPPPKDSSIYRGTNFSKGWHTYAIDWEPHSITWYIDGVARKTVHGVHVPNTQMQIIINLAVGGKLPGNPDNNTTFPQSLKTDYIRVYSSR